MLTFPSKINGFEPNPGFAVRAYMSSSPLTFLSVGCTGSIIIFGIAVRNFEYPLLDQAPSAVNFEYYWNSFWCMVLTMTTVGYGDIFPVTHLGRLTTILACIWGMFIMSMIIVTLTNIITLTSEENDAYIDLEESKEQ
jgi:potassium intermediate/small conductance calcium-activated channel subfamily N protein 2